MLKMKLNMILPSISLLKRMESPLGLRRKLKRLSKRGLNLTGTLFSKLWCLKDPCSSFSYRSSGSSETQDYVPPAQTSAVTNRPTSLPTHLYAKRLVLNLTRPSTILDAQRLRGPFSPSKGIVITSISPATSGFRVQILSMREEKPRD